MVGLARREEECAFSIPYLDSKYRAYSLTRDLAWSVLWRIVVSPGMGQDLGERAQSREYVVGGLDGYGLAKSFQEGASEYSNNTPVVFTWSRV